jgi:hypothetical protein
VKDQEPGREREAVGQEIDAADHDRLLDAMHLHCLGQGDAKVGGHAEHDPGADRHQPERQGFPEQMRPALALPGPAAEDVAHGRADDRRRHPGHAAGQVRPVEEYRQGNLAGGQRDHGDQDKPAEPLAH